MKVTHIDVAREINRVWPNFRNFVMPDEFYWLPKKKEVRKYLKESAFEKYKWQRSIFDCDDFALVLHAYIVEERYKNLNKIPEKERFAWAFGQVWGVRFAGKDLEHAINICVTRDKGVQLIEPQRDKMWKAKAKRDIPLFIRI
jgi:hypothetical protein